MMRLPAGLGVSVLAAGMLGLALNAPARAADDGYQNVVSSVLGAVGVLKADPPPEIEYRERAPLVLPPQATLPKPLPGGAKRAANWPQDPDIVRRRREAEEARAPHRQVANDSAEMLSAAEMAKGRAQGKPFQPENCGPNGNSRNCLLVNPDELRAEGERFAKSNPDGTDTVTAGQEPGREYLTQPPKGYMKATRTVKATAEAPQKKLDPANPRAFLVPERKDDE